MDNKNFDINNFTQNEKVLYFQPNVKPKIPYFQIGLIFIIALAIVVADGFLVGAEIMSNIIDNSRPSKILIYILAVICHVIPIVFWVFYLYKNYLRNKDSYYLITDKKIGQISNQESYDCRFIYYDKIKEVTLINNNLTVYLRDEKITFYGLAISVDMLKEIKGYIAK